MRAGARVIYVLERDHVPVEHGEIDASTEPREPLASLARAFEENYRRLLGEAKTTSA